MKREPICDETPADLIAPARGVGNGFILSLIFWAICAGLFLAVHHWGLPWEK